jgi:hypothetical protein
MQWLVGRILMVPLGAFVIVLGAFRWVIPPIRFVIRVLHFLVKAFDSANKRLMMWRADITEFRASARKMTNDVSRFAEDQHAHNPLDPQKKTVFLLITCGQAVRNFLLSDVLPMLRHRFNVVILSPYAYSEEFRASYGRPGVHVLPWFENFRSAIERFFLYYLMRKSGSGTHKSWLENLEARAKTATRRRGRYLKHVAFRRLSDLCGALLGTRGMQAFYHSYYLAFLPKSLFARLFSTYRPALVISTTAHHAEAWPLTYFGRRHGSKTLANILSWDNPTTKPAMDNSCDYYTVWSDEMKGELARHFPYIKTSAIVTGTPLFDIYYNRRSAVERAKFLASLGLPIDRPYILWTTNTPAAMPDESQIVARYWKEVNRTKLAGKVSLLVRVHPKEDLERYSTLRDEPNVAVTAAGKPHWYSSDRWLPSEEDMQLLLNSMLHAAVSVNVASTMSLESFALGLPTINVAFKSSDEIKDHGLMWSFSMYHTSDHYRALVDNGAVDLARSMEELIELTLQALDHGNRRTAAMRMTLEQKAAHCDGTSARRFVEVVEGILEPEREPLRAPARVPTGTEQCGVLPAAHATPAE